MLLLVPGKPLNVSIGDVNDSTIALSWSEPENPNGLIKGYRIYFMRKNFTDVQTVRNGEKFQKFILTDLGKLTWMLVQQSDNFIICDPLYRILHGIQTLAESFYLETRGWTIWTNYCSDWCSWTKCSSYCQPNLSQCRHTVLTVAQTIYLQQIYWFVLHLLQVWCLTFFVTGKQSQNTYFFMVCRREDAWDFEELAVATTTDRLDHMVNQTFPGKSLHET